MERNLWLRRSAVLFATICLIVLGAWYFAWPKTMRVAVGPSGGLEHRYLEAMARALRETQKPFRLELVSTENSMQAARLLDRRQVELAVLRSDDMESKEARSLTILGKQSVVMIVRADSGIDFSSKLQGRSIGIISPGGSFRSLIARIAEHYGGAPNDSTVEELTIRQFVHTPQRFDAYFLIADPSFRDIKAVVDAISAQEQAELSFLGMPAPAGLVVRMRELQKSSIPQGAFGGSPPKPGEELETVATTVELTATGLLSQSSATGLIEALVDLRTRMRRLMPRSTFDIEVPPVDEPRRFLPHVGAAAYVNDEEEKTFFETWSEQIWLGIFLLSIAGSSVTGFLAWSGFFDTPQTSAKLHARMSQLARRLSDLDNPIDLEAAQNEIDDIVISHLRGSAKSPADSEAQLSLALWTSSVNAIIERRRQTARVVSRAD